MKRMMMILLLLAAAQGWANDGVLRLRANGMATGPLSPDLDYNKPCTMEVLCYLRPAVQHGRNADIMRKGDDLIYSDASKRGWYIGIQNTKTGWGTHLGEVITFIIRDGANGMVANSNTADKAGANGRSGYVYAVMVYQPAARELDCYLNGNLLTTATVATALNAGQIAAAATFSLGGEEANQYGELNDDIHLARLWQRGLTDKNIKDLYDRWAATGGHKISGIAGLDRTGLMHEWVMDKASDREVVDTVSPNGCAIPLKMAGDGAGTTATVQVASGPLRLIYPADGATGVGPSARLIAGGGADTADVNSYRFQVDTAGSFDTANLRDSGWMPQYSEWTPTLKPSTSYFWRVQARGVQGTAGKWVGPAHFTTRAPREWFARPWQGGPYGASDGTSYANAWRGLTAMVTDHVTWPGGSVRWGESGIEAGDTLWICGDHWHDSVAVGRAGNENSRGEITLGVDGHPEAPVRIRGDHPEHPGTVWGYWRPFAYRTGWTWSGPDANGVYTSTGPGTGDLYADIGAPAAQWLQRAAGATWAGQPGAAWFDPATKTSYVKMPDGAPPAGRLWKAAGETGGGYLFRLGRHHYITFQGLKLTGSPIRGDIQQIGHVGLSPKADADPAAGLPRSTHITLDHCQLTNTKGALMALFKGNDFWTVSDCRLEKAGTGVYAYNLTDDRTAQNLTVRGCTIVEMGDGKIAYADSDGHAIGLQNVSHALIENNTTRHTGTAIEIWGGNPLTQEARDNVVRWNLIRETILPGKTSGAGIAFSGDKGKSDGRQTGWQVYGNVIVNPVGNGIGCNKSDPVKIWNNTIVNPGGHGINLDPGTTGGLYPQVELYNNIIVNPGVGKCFINAQGDKAADWTNFKSDHNLFWSEAAGNTGNGGFQASKRAGAGPDRAIALDAWRAQTGQDAHSRMADPQFVNPAGDDYRVKEGSPASHAGKAVGLTRDRTGRPAPQGGAPDIGADIAGNAGNGGKAGKADAGK